MNTFLKSLLISGLCMASASADYMLVLTDKDGNQTQECIKSYSFSNNLESIALKQGMVKDVYSEDETITNKFYNEKPIYRKIVTLPSNLVGDRTWRTADYIKPAEDIKDLISATTFGVEYLGTSDIRGTDNDLYYVFYDTYMGYIISNKRVGTLNGKKVVLEYTKNTDIVPKNEFKSYLHYVISDSSTDEVITKNMDELGIQFLKNYIYDESTSSCNKIQ